LALVWPSSHHNHQQLQHQKYCTALVLHTHHQIASALTDEALQGISDNPLLVNPY